MLYERKHKTNFGLRNSWIIESSLHLKCYIPEDYCRPGYDAL
jgi:hypothetical protein